MSYRYSIKQPLSSQDEHWIISAFSKSTKSVTYDRITYRLVEIELDKLGAFVLELYKAGWPPEDEFCEDKILGGK